MRTAIVGAGLTGLVVAFRRAAAGDEVILLSAGECDAESSSDEHDG